jgi:uncharacterized protein YgiM (DUF1202 family)
MRTKTKRNVIIIVFLSVFAMSSMIVAEESFARNRGRRDDSVQQRREKVDRSLPRQRGRRDDSLSRRRAKRRIISPRAARRGHKVRRLPRGYRRTWRNRVPYFYFSGIYYRPAPSGFIVVDAPIGSIVINLPVGYRRIWVGSDRYYVYGSVFYRRVPSGYLVVDPPTSVVIEDKIPDLVQPRETATGKVSVAASVLNVRVGPGLRYPAIYQIHEGYILEIHGREDGWLYVQLPNEEYGWVMTEYTIWLESPGSG